MASTPPKNSRVGTIQNRASNVSLAPLTPDEAMRRLLNVNPADVKKLKAEEKAAKAKPKKK